MLDGVRLVGPAQLFKHHETVIPEMKFVPVIVRLNPGPPTAAEEGVSWVIVGWGAMVMLNPAETDSEQSVSTLITPVPATVFTEEGSTAVNCVVLTVVVVRGVSSDVPV